MALDVQRITGTHARAAARLCNFVTNDAKLLKAHEDYLSTEVKAALDKFESPWVDLFGYASRKGSPTRNMKLSQQRLASVGKFIATYPKPVNFQTALGYGAEQSGDDPKDNSGYYRAVEVMVFGTKPPPRQLPAALPTANKYEIRVMGGGSGAAVAQADNFIFQIVDLVRKKTAMFHYTGVGIGLSIPKVPGAGSMTYAGPPTKFSTSKPVMLHAFNTIADLAQAPGVTLGSFSLGGTMYLEMTNVQDFDGKVYVRPSTLAISGGAGLQMPGLGSVTGGVLSLLTSVDDFVGYV